MMLLLIEKYNCNLNCPITAWSTYGDQQKVVTWSCLHKVYRPNYYLLKPVHMIYKHLEADKGMSRRDNQPLKESEPQSRSVPKTRPETLF